MFRFQVCNPEKVCDNNYPAIKIMQSGRFGTKLSSFSEKFQKGLESGSERINRFRTTFEQFLSNSDFSRSFGSKRKILDPQGSFLQKWNKIFVLLCAISVSLNPLFFYVPMIDDEKKCLSLDNGMEITATVLRSFFDVLYIIRMYLSSYFLVDILAVLSLPQVWKVIRNLLFWGLVSKCCFAVCFTYKIIDSKLAKIFLGGNSNYHSKDERV